MIVDVKYPQFAFKLDLNDPVNNWMQKKLLEVLDRGHLYEPESSFVADRIQPGDLFFDFGAHLGYYSLVAAHAAGGKVKVHSYEPNTENYHGLLRQIEVNKITNITPHHCAVSLERGVGSLSLNADNDGGHALWPVADHPDCVKTRARGPRSERIWVESAGIAVNEQVILAGATMPQVWIKADVEGSEMEVLKSLLKYQYFMAPVLILEINRTALQMMGSSEDELRNTLYGVGYKSYVHSVMKLFEVAPGDYVQGNNVHNMVFWPAHMPPMDLDHQYGASYDKVKNASGL